MRLTSPCGALAGPLGTYPLFHLLLAMLHALSLNAALLALAALAPQNPVPAGPGVDLQPQPRGRLCSTSGVSHPMGFLPGATVENFFVTSGDPDLRRFLITVPTTYDPTRAYPVVFMLHGTGQTAGDSVTRLSWDEGADLLDYIAVFPEALEYLLLDSTTRSKWATDNVINNVVDPTELPLADDVLFLRELYHTLDAHLNIDCSRIYASGFSNGGAMVKTKIRTEMWDIFAATSSAGGMGVQLSHPTEFWPNDLLSFRPHFEIVGNQDAKKKEYCVTLGDIALGQNLPLAAANIQATPCMWDSLTALAEQVGMVSTLFSSVETGTMTQILWSDESQASGTNPREYRFRILQGLTHEYPSGTNYSVEYVPIIYDWMSQYTL